MAHTQQYASRAVAPAYYSPAPAYYDSPRQHYSTHRKVPYPVVQVSVFNFDGQSTSSHSSSTSSKSVRKQTRFLLDGIEKGPKSPVYWERPAAFSAVPTTNARPFIPTFHHQRQPSYDSSFTSDDDSDASSTSSFEVVDPPTLPRAPRPLPLELAEEKALPTPPPSIPSSPLQEVVEAMFGSPSLESSISSQPPAYDYDQPPRHAASTPAPRHRPVIIRTQSSSLTVLGSLKAIWKKATAHVRNAVVEKERDSIIWNGFAKVPVAMTEEASKRSSGWWRAREVAVLETSSRSSSSSGRRAPRAKVA